MAFEKVRADETHGPVTEADARAMVRLVGEAGGLEQGVPARKRYLMAGLCELVDADSWFWSCACNASIEGEAPMTLGFVYDGFTPKQLASFVAAQTHEDTAGIMAKFQTYSREGLARTYNLYEHIDRPAFFKSEALGSVGKRFVCPMDDDTCSR